jgi:hypothetical protein
MILSATSRAADTAFSTQCFTDVDSHRGRLAEIVEVTGPSKTIFVWGVEAEDEDIAFARLPIAGMLIQIDAVGAVAP